MGIRVGRADDNNNSNPRAPGSQRSSGFTLLELLAALTIAAILLAIATPSFSEFRLNARITSAANDLLAAVQHARTEAAKRQQPVSLCVLQNPVGEQPACAGESLEQLAAQGWLVFVDPNRDCARAAADPVINITSRVGADDGLTSQATGGCISFAPNGFLLQANTGFVLCDRRAMRTTGSGETYARGIALSPSGAARITRDAAHINDVMGFTCPSS
jgi:type IV fimbrial biogenesis protein FimT